MSRFSLRLHSVPGRAPVEETLEAADEVEAAELARMRLLLTADYRRVELTRDGAPLADYHRDGPH